MPKKKFNGRIALDIRDAQPDWSPYEPPKAKRDAPNVFYIVWDDVGFGAFECFGGMIETPNMTRLANQGLRYTNFHTTALCSPTRSCLLTGRNATSNGMGCISEASSGFPGSNGHVPFENGYISETLVDEGYNTYAVGKWHLTPGEETHMAANKRQWPLGRGFERFYGFLGGETDQWYPDLVQDNQPIEQPARPEEGYHLSVDLADTAIQYIRDAKVIAPQKPWLMYFCPGAGHAPHQVPQEWADKYKGKFDMGWDAYREQTLQKQIEMGILPEGTELPPINAYVDETSAEGKEWPEGDVIRDWDSLDEDEKTLFCRMAEVYAGFVSHCDHHIGRVLDYLEESGQLDNTIVVVVSDNGASGEGGPNGSVNENKFFNGIPDSLEENMKYLDVLGSTETYNHYPNGWAQAFCAPFKMYKRYSGHEGGTADPCIVSWPRGIQAKGEIRDQYIHATDIVPTIYDCLDFEPPAEVKGYTQSELEGVSFKHTFEDASAPTHKRMQIYGMLGTRGIWAEGWHAAAVHPAISGWSHFAEDRWELFHLDEDRTQAHDLADEHPDKLEKLKQLWFMLAGKYNALPIDDRTAPEVLMTPRPQPAPERNVYVYYPNCADVPEMVAANTHGRSYDIACELTVDEERAEGVLFAHGGRFGGHSLYVHERRLHYVYNWLGENEQKVTSNKCIPTGRHTFGARFDLTGTDGPSPTGTVELYIDEECVGTLDIKTQPAHFALGGEGLAVGRDGGQPVSSDYKSPFEFTGGTIKQVNIDLRGERIRDLEQEAKAMMSRE
ncbi:arylsulfatase [Persicimonas caeni]|uniref:Arylsulfatase n=1 Tax=Persicimonas caeni TaxID=2292766 RepID=A0A4Y6PZS4_PERCE|nr:arylsulfatase [Persicimonas caeni]QDG53828.1 arylsulfatase [Persicimonas caeni]QED35049.1 arylsulfatase [Persicimonas caeni]